MSASTPGALYLADGSSWPATSVGFEGCAVGEAVFTTGMTGYQESLTDPSFYGQLLCFTTPMIGNYGIEPGALESPGAQVRALLCHEARNAAPAGRRGLVDWLVEQQIVALAELDTRALVRHLRDRGAMLAVAVGDGRSEAEARALLAAEPAMTGRSLADAVAGLIDGDESGARCRVVVVDYGTKASIVHLLEQAGASVEVVRHDTTAAEILALEPDGVLLANGPGDPGAMDSHADEVRGLIESGRPVFGICLGHQLVGRALGLETYKLPFGHRGANHPVLERATGRVLVTSQNHGFAVREPASEGASEIDVTHVSLYDNTVEGLRVRDRPVWSMQFHPEASPGPHDARIELERFVDVCAAVHDAARVGA
jgi:carbamoyl-phosphate synthase small subunit